MKTRFNGYDWKNLLGRKYELDEEEISSEVTFAEAENYSDCYGFIKFYLERDNLEWASVFARYTIEDIVDATRDDKQIIESLLALDTTREPITQYIGKVSVLSDYIMSIQEDSLQIACKRFWSRNMDFFIDELLSLEEMIPFFYSSCAYKPLCNRLGRVVERYGWQKAIEVFPLLEKKILTVTIKEVLKGNPKCLENWDDGAAEVLQCMADIEKYRGIYFHVVRNHICRLMNVVPICELPEVTRILNTEMGFSKKALDRHVEKRFVRTLKFLCDRAVGAHDILKGISCFDYGYDLILKNLPMLLKSNVVKEKQLTQSLGISLKAINLAKKCNRIYR